jgi:hypothetical protein
MDDRGKRRYPTDDCQDGMDRSEPAYDRVGKDGPDLELEILIVDGKTTYRVYGREYDDLAALPPSVREAILEAERMVCPTGGTTRVKQSGSPEGLHGEWIADCAAVDTGCEDRIGSRIEAGGQPCSSGHRGAARAQDVPTGREAPERAISGRFLTTYAMMRAGESVATLGADDDPDSSPDPYVRAMQRREQKIGAVFRTLAYLALLLWTWAEPQGLAPFIFLGFMLADFFTWVAEVFLAGVVWRSRRYRARDLGLSLLGYGIMFGLLYGLESFEAPEGGLDWARTESMFAFFFTLCGKTVAIAVRRAAEITRGY